MAERAAILAEHPKARLRSGDAVVLQIDTVIDCHWLPFLHYFIYIIILLLLLSFSSKR